MISIYHFIAARDLVKGDVIRRHGHQRVLDTTPTPLPGEQRLLLIYRTPDLGGRYGDVALYPDDQVELVSR